LFGLFYIVIVSTEYKHAILYFTPFISRRILTHNYNYTKKKFGLPAFSIFYDFFFFFFFTQERKKKIAKNYFRAKKTFPIQALLLINSLQSFVYQLISPRILSPLEMDI